MSTFMMAAYRNNSTTPVNRRRRHTTIASAAADADASAASKGKKPYKSWLKDGVNGGQSSMEILVRWLSDKNNYAKWRGEINYYAADPISTTTTTSHSHVNSSSNSSHHEQHHRTPKKFLLEEIVVEMRKAGIYHRFPKDVASKISTLQSNYRAAREWYEIEGRRLMREGAVGSAIHAEIQKRFPYWDALHECFGSSIQSPTPSFSPPPSSSSDPMSLSSIIDHQQQYYQDDEDEDDQLAQDDDVDDVDDDNDDDESSNSSRSSSSSSSSSNNHDDGDDNYTDEESHVSMPKRRQDDAKGAARDLRNSLIQVTREKDAGRMKRSRDVLGFLRKKRMSREQYLIGKERTRRIRAKAEFVKNLTDAGFSKQEISEQLSTL